MIIKLKLDEQYDLKRFDLDLSDPKCVILASCEGAASEWNRKNTNQVFPYDRIAWVDGKPCESQDLLDMLRRDKASPIQLILERPRKRLLYLKKPGVLGLDMTFTLVDTKPWKASVRPWISSIEEGLVAEWNANMPELSVGPHDRIISVNSKGGSPAELADMLAAAEDVVELEVLHYNL